MPTYEYACKSCGEHLEVVQSFKDDALTECPNCRGSLKKVFGNIGIVFKGSGFYKTDSRSGRSAAKLAANEGGSSSSESKAEPSKESAPKSDSTPAPAAAPANTASAKTAAAS